MKQRIEFIDLAKGICILLVVLVHIYGDMSGRVIKFMSLFRMPLYFVLSGLFFKTYDGLWLFIKKKTNKLLIPFFSSFFIVTLPTTILFNRMKGIDTTFNALFFAEYGHGHLNLGIICAAWFLLCLFFVNVIFYLIFMLSHHRLSIIVFLGGVCGIIGYTLNVYDIYLPIWIDTALTATPFFIMGYCMKQYAVILYDSFTKKYFYLLLGAFIILLSIYCMNEYREPCDIEYVGNKYNFDILSLYIAGIAGTYCVLIISKFFSYLPVISYIGRYSIVVLLTHQLYLFILRNILYQFDIPQDSELINAGIFIIIVLLSIPTIKFCVKCLPYCFAQKDILK